MRRLISKIFLLLIPFLMVPSFASAISTDPLIYANNLEYLGAFRVPDGKFGGTTDNWSFAFSGGNIAYNPANNSLFITGHIYNQMVAEITIPEPVNDASLGSIPTTTSKLANLKVATVLQNFSDITEGNLSNIGVNGAVVNTSGVRIGGYLVDNNKIVGTSYGYYDANGSVKLSHFTSGLNLSQIGDFQGMFKVDTTPTINPGYLDGFMTSVPSNLQAMLGGRVLTGNGGLSIISRTSSGPAAFSFDPMNLGVLDPTPATALLYYPLSHNPLKDLYTNPVTLSNPYFNLTSKFAGVTMIPGSRSAIFFGYNGIGPYGYGNPTADPTKVGTDCLGDTAICYYDPLGSGKGPHAFPYIYQVYAYDANDMAAVKSGTKQPWEVLPYAVWKLPYPFAGTTLFGGSSAYDPTTQRLYISEPAAERAGCCSPKPLIHVFHVNLSAAIAPAYKVGGQAMLLNGVVTLKNNGVDNLVITATDRKTTQNFSFTTPVATRGSYNVTIANQPVGQTCVVINGTGTINANADIANIVITCDGTGGIQDAIAPVAPTGLTVI